MWYINARGETMFSVIDANDSKVMANSRFVKNAVLYKDMLAFFDLYENVMSAKKRELPNFVFLPSGGYCLEGICLIAKNYASELGFETLNLTLEYLKTIYYTIASFAGENGKVDKKFLTSEFEEYKKASKNASDEISSETKGAYKKYEESKKIFEKENQRFAKNLILSKVFNVLYIFFLVLGFLSAMIPFSFYFMEKITIVKTAIIAGVCLVVGIGFTLLFWALERKFSIASSDTAYGMQILKKNKDNDFLAYKDVRDKENKILSEKYEYENQFIEEIKKYGKVLSVSEVFNLAKEYKLTSYNYKRDIAKLFKSEQTDVEEIVYDLSVLKPSLNNLDIANLYSKIKEKDWLYYNNQVRFNFLNKFISRAEKNKEWTITTEENEENPFGINIKKLAKEEIAYLKSEDGLFVSSSLDKFLNTKFIKNLKEFEIKNKSSYEELKNIKVQYMKHFYNYESVKDYNNLFYDKKIQEGIITISDEIIENNKKIPSLIALKIKLLEDRIGYGNSNSSVIKQISSFITEEVKEEELLEVEPIEIAKSESETVKDITSCDKVEIIDETKILYTSGGESFIGYIFADATE